MAWETLLDKAPSLMVVVYILVKGASAIWKFYTEKVYPESSSQEEDRRKREDRLFSVIEHNAQAWTEMKITMLALKESMDRQGEVLGRTASSIDRNTVLYEILQRLIELPGHDEKLDDVVRELSDQRRPKTTLRKAMPPNP